MAGTFGDEQEQASVADDSEVISLSVPIELDDLGYWDRRCPSEECGFSFKIHYDDFKEKVPDEGARCPFCGHAAGAYDFNTEDQAEYLKQVAIAHVTGTMTAQLRDMAARFNCGQPRGGFITMRMDVSTPEQTVALPPSAAETMTLRIACRACGCRFAVVGAAYFCPTCGHNSAPETFSQSLAAVRNDRPASDHNRGTRPGRVRAGPESPDRGQPRDAGDGLSAVGRGRISAFAQGGREDTPKRLPVSG